ncbi:MAG TPA: hypothetical protein VGH98_08100 [Gemmatimonadaceae bacterium]|jgi:hypothetical protein
MRPRRFLVVSSLIFAFTTSAFAQTQEQIPKDLALALMPGATEGGEIIIGQMPMDLTTLLTLPAGAHVLGSFVNTAYAHAVLTLPLRTDSALAVMRRSLAEHGFTTRSAATPPMGGLQYGPPGGIYPNSFCKAGDPTSLTVSAQFYGPSMTLVHLTRNVNSTICDQPRTDIVRTQAMQDYPLSSVPPLWSPGDFRASNTRCRRPSAGGDAAQSQPLMSELSPAEVLAYYSKQLDSAGWKSTTAEPDRVSKTWSKAIGTRGTQEVTITISRMASQSGCYDVALRATGLPPR